MEKLTEIAKFLSVDVNWLLTGHGLEKPKEDAGTTLRDEGPVYGGKASLDERVTRLESVVAALQAALRKV
jgi:hypothetical protein